MAARSGLYYPPVNADEHRAGGADLPGPLVTAADRKGFVISALLKGALVALLLVGAFSGLEQFQGKAFGWRLVAYPPATLVVLAAWLAQGRRTPYPAAADVFITLPFLIDVVGNALDLYDTVPWWDDANHLVNWWLLSMGVMAWLPGGLGRWPAAAIVLGFGGVSAIAWELLEYVSFIRDSPELATAYTDTLGDLALGTLGSACAAAIAFVREVEDLRRQQV